MSRLVFHNIVVLIVLVSYEFEYVGFEPAVLIMLGITSIEVCALLQEIRENTGGDDDGTSDE